MRHRRDKNTTLSLATWPIDSTILTAMKISLQSHEFCRAEGAFTILSKEYHRVSQVCPRPFVRPSVRSSVRHKMFWSAATYRVNGTANR